MANDAACAADKTDDANTVPGPIHDAHLGRLRTKESCEPTDCSYDKTDSHDAKTGMLWPAAKQLEPKCLEFALSHVRCLTLELSGGCRSA